MYKYFWTLLLINPLTFVSDRNQTQFEAVRAHQSQDYITAIVRYQYLVEELGVDNPSVLTNLAQVYYAQKDYTEASVYYQRVTEHTQASEELRSMAWVQLGLIAEATQQYDEALIAFQKAIEQFRPNYLARYNYELLKRRLRNQEVSQAPNPDGATQQQPQNARPDANGVAQTEQVPDKDGEEQNLPEKEANPSGTQTIEQATSNPSPEELALLKRLQQMNLDPETANMLLDAMKNQELQYWQQLQRIPKNNKHKNNKKPNW